MSDHSAIGSAKMSMAGGILTVIFMNIQAADIIKTIVLASIGAVVSFFISMVLKYFISRWRK